MAKVTGALHRVSAARTPLAGQAILHAAYPQPSGQTSCQARGRIFNIVYRRWGPRTTLVLGSLNHSCSGEAYRASVMSSSRSSLRITSSLILFSLRRYNTVARWIAAICWESSRQRWYSSDGAPSPGS